MYRKGRRDILGLHRQVGLARGRGDSPSAAIFTRGCEDLLGYLGREPGPGAGAAAVRSKITPLQFSTLTKAISAVEDKCFLDLEHLLIILATTISAAPFLGLLGTVWGILEAFQAMGRQGATGVTAVGSGISEALIATAFGLMVAIPALLGYNFIGARIREIAGETDQFLADFLAVVERDFVRE
jgi:biopolymer transport protein ExbB/TolQ